VAGQATLHLLDLKRGTDHRLAVPIDQGAAFDNETVAWSPESRWLFVAGLKGKLLVVDTHTNRVHHLGLALPPITQVAVRRNARVRPRCSDQPAPKARQTAEISKAGLSYIV
jgi:hypothetical protein